MEKRWSQNDQPGGYVCVGKPGFDGMVLTRSSQVRIRTDTPMRLLSRWAERPHWSTILIGGLGNVKFVSFAHVVSHDDLGLYKARQRNLFCADGGLGRWKPAAGRRHPRTSRADQGRREGTAVPSARETCASRADRPGIHAPYLEVGFQNERSGHGGQSQRRHFHAIHL